MSYRQITTEERYTISNFYKQGLTYSEIGRIVGRHRSSIMREIKRNCCNDGVYRPSKASSRTRCRRRESRRKWYTPEAFLRLVIVLIRMEWSPEQVSGWLALNKICKIHFSTIYRYIWYDQKYGGNLFQHLRQSSKARRKRYRSRDSRGILSNKRHISERPISVDNKTRYFHWEIDTVHGSEDQHCIVTIVERKTKYTIIGKMKSRSATELAEVVTQLINREANPFLTITADNGTEFHSYQAIESAISTKFYFANPYHSWERGLNENTNGLIRQYLP